MAEHNIGIKFTFDTSDVDRIKDIPEEVQRAWATVNRQIDQGEMGSSERCN